jgi:hypothetical protein
MSNLIKFVSNLAKQQSNNEVEQATTNSVDTGLNYQFMYKQLESAVEEIIIQYPNDPIVNELKGKLVRNLRPILELIQNDPDNNYNQ